MELYLFHDLALELTQHLLSFLKKKGESMAILKKKKKWLIRWKSLLLIVSPQNLYVECIKR